jgi:phytoene dehydrogenase-like protein
MSETCDVVIIGAGIGGLSTGLHLVDKGYRTLILEAHTSPGGLCTSFERQGFTFDTCIHWLVGCSEGGMIWRTLNHFGLLPLIKLRRLDQFETIITPDKQVTVGDDLSEFERFLCRVSPSDEKEIIRFFKEVKALPKMVVTSKEDWQRHPLGSIAAQLSYWPLLPLTLRWRKHSIGSFLSRFKKSQKIKPYMLVCADDLSALANYYLFSFVHRQDMYAPQVTSLEFSRAFESKFLEMGGHIRYRARATKILVKGDRAGGVRLESGDEVYARVVVSNADGYQTLFQLLGQEFVPKGLAHLYATAPTFGSMLLISLGVGTTLTENDTPARMISEWMTLENTSTSLSDLHIAPISYKIESLYNPSVALPGKSVILVEAAADYAEWKTLFLNKERYTEAKDKVREIAIRRAEKCFPQIRGKVEVADVATPVTFERYTSNREGSIQGWRMTPAMARRMNLPFRPTKLPNFFMVGQWVSVAGGIPPSIMGGDKVAGLVQKWLR